MSEVKLYFIAGERSGDLHGSTLVKELNKLTPQKLQLRGIGGKLMREQGIKTLFGIEALAVFGFYMVIMNIFRITKILRQCKKDILIYKPDLVILIDSGGFNLKIAKFCHQHNIPVYYYIPPKVWVWGSGRIEKLRKYVDQIFVILPFEKDYYRDRNLNVHYVGNPLLGAVQRFKPDPNFITAHQLGDKPIIAVLPGSRKQEISLLLKVLVKVATFYPDYLFVIAGVHSLPQKLYQIPSGENVKFIFEQTYEILNIATAALVASGTATLETALFRVPQAVCYKFPNFEYQLLRPLIKKVRKRNFFSLVNLIAKRLVVCELFQRECNEKTLAHELKLLLEGDTRKQVLDAYEQIIERIGKKNPSEEVAQHIVKHIDSLFLPPPLPKTRM